MFTIKIQVWLLFMFVLIPALVCATTLQHYPIAKPNCVDKCGNVSIPYPFGTTENCYRNNSFLVSCNETFTPPQLFIQTTNLQITKISLTGQLKVMLFVAKTCYFPNATLASKYTTRLTLPDLFTVSNTANKFTVVGCDSSGLLSGYRWWTQFYRTGCIATCSNLQELDDDGSCTGLGCCQTSTIPQDTWEMNVTAESYNNYINVTSLSNCTYAFLVEDHAFRFSPDKLTSLHNVDALPAVVDWVIGRETCESAKKNSTSYACGQNSKCMMSTSKGYTCVCESGYEGNPYLGCQDINECAAADHNCTYVCNNTPGGFICGCPKGYLGEEQGERRCYCPNGYHTNVNGIIREGACSRNDSRIYKFVAGAALGVILILLFSCLVYLVLKRKRSKKMKHMYFLRNGGVLLQEKLTSTGQIASISFEGGMASCSDTTKVFSSTELERATNNFHSSMIVGKGGFGTVYKGFLDDHRIVAIKKSKEVDPTQIDQFINEVVVLSRVSHRNIVKLLGCCLETPVPHLVYEFVDNGTLYEHIHNPVKKHFLNWNVRLRIATETAEVLSYLHSAATTPIIHRDVKSSNILLGHNFEAKVSDFGTSRLIPIDKTRLSTMVQGTFGYLDPEYMQTNQLTEKSDVYSFGVVLLELLTGVKPLSYDRPEEDRNLTNYFLRKLTQGRLHEVLDETIICENVNLEQVTGVAKLAQVCIHLKGQDRPCMKQVAMVLEGLRTTGNLEHSWIKFDDNVEEMEPFSGNVLEGFANGVGFDSLRDDIISGVR